MSRLDEIIEDLSSRKRSIRCNGKDGLLSYMKEVGFEWKLGKVQGHKVFVHEALTKRTSGLFTTYGVDCGHKPSRNMKFQYVVKTISILRKYEFELNEIMGDL